jgi:hypothetical protein
MRALVTTMGLHMNMARAPAVTIFLLLLLLLSCCCCTIFRSCSAAWLQVPLQVWQSCSRLAQSAHPIKTAIAISAACSLFRLLVGRDSRGATLSSKASSTQRGLLQQLQQSSLLQQLPLLLTVAAHKTQAAAAAAATACGDAELAAFHASQGDSSPAAPGWEPAGDPEVLAKTLLCIFADTCILQTHIYVSTAEGAACVLPAMQLIVVATQYLTHAATFGSTTTLTQTCTS